MNMCVVVLELLIRGDINLEKLEKKEILHLKTSLYKDFKTSKLF